MDTPHPDGTFPAGDPSQSPEALREVYEHARPSVRKHLAENPATPEELLHMLSRDSDPEVRASLACNRSVPPEILEALAVDSDLNVRMALAQETALPPYILQKICGDDNPYVSARAQATLDALSFENQLKSAGFIQQSGSTAKLGELLIAAGVLDNETLDFSLQATQEEELPLGRILVKTNTVDAEIVIRALKLQSLVRNGKISVESAYQKLTTACNQRRATMSREISF